MKTQFDKAEAIEVAQEMMLNVLEYAPGYASNRYEGTEQNWADNDEIEAFVRAVGPKIVHDAEDYPYYHMSEDVIHMPAKKRCKCAADYYGPLFHELTHWTGHKSRNNRNVENISAGSPEHCVEEMCAEFGSAYLMQHFGMGHARNHAGYVSNWLTPFRKNIPVEKVWKAAMQIAAVQSMKAVSCMFDLANTCTAIQE